MENQAGSVTQAELSKLKMAQLQALASERGLKGTSRMRKSDLIAALSGTGKPEKAPAGQEPGAGKPEKAQKQRPPKEQKDTSEAPKDEQKQQAPGQQSSARGSGPKDRGDQKSKADAREAVAEQLEKTRGKAKEGSGAAEAAKSLEEIELPEGGDQNRNRNRRDRGSRRRGRGGQNRGQGGGQRRENDNEPLDEDSLVPIAGIVDVQSNHAFVRTSGYLPGDSDVYVTLGNVRRWGLRPGDAVVGAVRAAREGERRGNQKYNALVRVDSINGMSIEDAAKRRDFAKLTPEYPKEQLRLETTPKAITPRMIDLVAPVGKGQRGLIVSPPKAGKTMIIQQIAKAIEINDPDVHLMVVLVDERPEEVTDMRSIVNGEVIASTFDRPASDHTLVAELAIERAKRLVELGQDVVVLLDSITRLSRAYNLAAPASGRILSGGVDAAALYPPKKFFGAARNLREGGSLTIIASALVETGSKMDEVIFEEFKGTGNMELRLSRALADRRIFPAIDINASGTRREEMLFKPEELAVMWKLRRALGNLDQQAALESVLGKLKDTQQNAEFLMLVQRTTASD